MSSYKQNFDEALKRGVVASHTSPRVSVKLSLTKMKSSYGGWRVGMVVEAMDEKYRSAGNVRTLLAKEGMAVVCSCGAPSLDDKSARVVLWLRGSDKRQDLNVAKSAPYPLSGARGLVRRILELLAEWEAAEDAKEALAVAEPKAGPEPKSAPLKSGDWVHIADATGFSARADRTSTSSAIHNSRGRFLSAEPGGVAVVLMPIRGVGPDVRMIKTVHLRRMEPEEVLAMNGGVAEGCEWMFADLVKPEVALQEKPLPAVSETRDYLGQDGKIRARIEWTMDGSKLSMRVLEMDERFRSGVRCFLFDSNGFSVRSSCSVDLCARYVYLRGSRSQRDNDVAEGSFNSAAEMRAYMDKCHKALTAWANDWEGWKDAPTESKHPCHHDTAVKNQVDASYVACKAAHLALKGFAVLREGEEALAKTIADACPTEHCRFKCEPFELDGKDYILIH